MNKSLSAFLFLMLALAASVGFAQTSKAKPQPAGQSGAKNAAADTTLPYTPGLDVSAMDKSVAPCVDFYKYSCGGWQKKNPIPSDQTSWGVYNKLYQDNLAFLRTILEQAASAKSNRDSATRLIGDFYGACMDEKAVEKRGLSVLRSELEAIARVKSAHDLAPVIVHMQLAIPEASIVFRAESSQDPDDSEQQIASFDQGGLGLPDRDYYTKDDAKSKEIRKRYVQYVQKMFALLGEPAAAAGRDADTVMRMETALARSSLTRVERRDPYKMKNKMKIADLEKLAPNLDWQTYLGEAAAPKFEILNVTAPAFFKEVNRLLAEEPLENWKTYLRYHLANGYAAYLSSPFVLESFEFYSKYLRGAKEMRPRWKRCVQAVDKDLGEALGQAYVRKAFSPELKASTLDMVRRIQDAMEQRIQHLDWMSPETKQQALSKLHSMRNKIGYPDQWRDYSSLKVVPGDLLGNIKRATEFEAHRQINKIGKPVDHNEWGMSPPTVNAYYDPQMNDINFSAGVLQPPLYDAKMDDAPNYGNTGGTVGHELTHGFDDEGSQYDAKGNLKDWWSKEDKEKFEARTVAWPISMPSM